MDSKNEWSIVKEPFLEICEQHYYTQTYIDLGNGSGIYDIAEFRANFPHLAQQYIDTDSYNHWQDDVYAKRAHDRSNKAYVLYIAPGTQHEMVLLLPGALSKVQLDYTIYIIVGAQAVVTIHHDQLGAAHTHMTVHLEACSKLTLLQSNKHAKQQYTYLACYQRRESTFIMHGWYRDVTYNHMNLFLQESSAQAEISLGVDTNSACHSWFKTAQMHQASATKSKLVLKGLVSDTAKSVHKGMVYIGPDLEHVTAELTSRYLLLNNNAQAYTVPSLEVLSRDVQCAHASAIGSYDQGQLFYLQSRGLSQQQAQKLLRGAFFKGFWYI